MKNRVRLAIASLILLSLPQHALNAQHVPADLEGTSKIAGKVLDAEGKKLEGARVLAYHLSSARLFTSKPTSGGGEYRMTGLPYGYYDLAVETPDGLFVADRVLNLAPAGAAAVIFTVVPDPTGAAGTARKHPGSDQEPSGVARLRKKPKGREYWRSPKGVAIITGLAGAGLLAIAAGSETESSATVF
jgi:hypothetical protein